MLRVFHGFECATNKELFEQMLCHRRHVRHRGQRPDNSSRDYRQEIDEFDRDDTIYLMVVDSRKNVVGSARLLSTFEPHLLSDPLRDTFPDARFSTPRIWEASRFIFLEGEGANSGTKQTAVREIIVGMGALAREHKVERIAAIYDESAATTLQNCHLPYKAGPCPSEYGTLFLGLWEVSEILVASMINTSSPEGLSSIPTDREAD